MSSTTQRGGSDRGQHMSLNHRPFLSRGTYRLRVYLKWCINLSIDFRLFDRRTKHSVTRHVT